MKLVGALTSPYVRKVRVVMAEKRLDFQFVLAEPPRSPEARVSREIPTRTRAILLRDYARLLGRSYGPARMPRCRLMEPKMANLQGFRSM